MLLGVYSFYLTSVSSLYFPILIPLGIGVILGSFCFMKLTKFLLDHFYAPTFFCIIGFTFGSILVLLPNFTSNLDILIGILSCLLRFLHGIFLSSYSKQVRGYNISFLQHCVSDQTSKASAIGATFYNS